MPSESVTADTDRFGPHSDPYRSIRTALRDAERTLAEAGCDTPRLDAELLLAEALGVGRDWLVREARAGLGPEAFGRFEALVARRAAREPVAYILGRKDFRWITLEVDPGVLVPRPETELLVDVGLGLPPAARVVDVGTGSGAVALAIKHERPDLSVLGTDVSPAALEVARGNARRLGLDVEFVHTDLLAGLGERFDAVLANLPYVPEGAVLAPEIAKYEPAGALFAGADGLDLIRRLVGMVGGAAVVALEIGSGQADAVAALLRGAGFSTLERLRDLAGHERVVVGRG
jgi:release factor glutamine methyltransferase